MLLWSWNIHRLTFCSAAVIKVWSRDDSLSSGGAQWGCVGGAEVEKSLSELDSYSVFDLFLVLQLSEWKCSSFLFQVWLHSETSLHCWLDGGRLVRFAEEGFSALMRRHCSLMETNELLSLNNSLTAETTKKHRSRSTFHRHTHAVFWYLIFPAGQQSGLTLDIQDAAPVKNIWSVTCRGPQRCSKMFQDESSLLIQNLSNTEMYYNT